MKGSRVVGPEPLAADRVVSEIPGTCLGFLFFGDPTMWGSILEVPYFRKPPSYGKMLLKGGHCSFMWMLRCGRVMSSQVPSHVEAIVR